MDPAKIIMSVIAIVIALALTPTVQEGVTDANLTGTAGSLGDLIPIIYVAGILVVAVYAFMKQTGRR